MTTEDKICKQLEIIAEKLEDLNNTLQTAFSESDYETIFTVVKRIADRH